MGWPKLSAAEIADAYNTGATSQDANLRWKYTFDDGTATDVTGNGNDGTINGAVPGTAFDDVPSKLISDNDGEIKTEPVTTMISPDSYMAVWVEGTSSAKDIKGQMFNTNGDPIGNEFPIIDEDGTNQNDIAVATLENGNVVVSYYDGSASETKAVIIDTATTSIGTPFTVTSGGIGALSSITPLSDGGFVISYTQTTVDSDIHAARFNADGTPSGTAVEINTTEPTLTQTWPHIVELNDGGTTAQTCSRMANKRIW